MKSLIINMLTALMLQSVIFAHGGGKHVKLHVNPKWKECSFQLDSSLTQSAWSRFAQEAGLVTYFRPLLDAQPMGRGNYEFSLLQWQTKFDDTDPEWNNTFVHPDSNHWLKKSERLPFPGLTFRVGVTNRVDVGGYWTKSPGANYGFYGGQVQYNFLNEIQKRWALSGRLSFVSLYGPKDLDFTVYGLDVLASREYAVYRKWFSVAPYAGISAYITDAHEKSAVVNLKDETGMGVHAMIGVVTKISKARLAVEYNFGEISTFSFKLGVMF